LGFFHEQARPDSNQYIDVKYDNISPARYNNFLPAQEKEVRVPIMLP
jgi:hypothetical protein